ncbi:hypothetical protein D4Q80_02690 [bacterium]|nr:MAG: hypothetical protein D4Q80_02690 [bacterium]
MKKSIFVFAGMALLVVMAQVKSAAQELVWEEAGRGNSNIRTVLVNPDNPDQIYIGRKGSLLKSEDAGNTWRVILSLQGENKEVNFLLNASQDKNSLFAATAGGLYYSPDAGARWQRIFRGKSYLENECTSLAVLASSIYLGTKGGLFISQDNGRSWHKETGVLGKSRILAVAVPGEKTGRIYVACVEGVFMSEDAGKSWQRIFVSNPTEDGEASEENIEDNDKEEKTSIIRYIALDPGNPDYLYLASSRGAYLSTDRGKTWNMLSSYGLLSRKVDFLLASQDSRIYAITKSGIFRYEGERWQELSFKLAAQKINFLALDKEDNLYAAADKGLFKAKIARTINNQPVSGFSLYSQGEPGIKEVQQAAIRYAEVEPDKIKKWRQQAAHKALLPTVNVGIDRDTGDLWHWESGSSTKPEDDVLRSGRDSIGWDVSLAWDLGELIWNDDQTSIDVRSRLLVQLRDDILDEVTKLYFERLRVKAELDGLALEDRKKRFEKELRIAELTANLDALTGGYFSEQIK